MKKSFRLLSQNPLFYGGLVTISGGLLASILSYAYYFIFGRIMSPVLYGELTTIISIWTIILTFFSSFGAVIVKYSAKKDPLQGAMIYSWINRDVLKLILTICILIILSSAFLVKILNIDLAIFFLLAPIIYFSAFSMLYGSIIQGALKFNQLTILNLLPIFTRLIIGLLLFLVGMELFGVIAGILAGSISSYFLAKHYVNMLNLPVTKIKIDRGKILKYAFPAMVTFLAIGSIFSSDMILAKIFLESNEAGVFAATSMMGKIIFYFSAPLTSVVFSISARKNSEGKKTVQTFLSSLVFVSMACLFFIGLYKLYPEFITTNIFGNKYIQSAKYLFEYGLFASIFSISSLIANYYLSLGFMGISYLTVAAAIIQILGITLFHSTINEIIFISTITCILLIIFQIIYGIKKYI